MKGIALCHDVAAEQTGSGTVWTELTADSLSGHVSADEKNRQHHLMLHWYRLSVDEMKAIRPCGLYLYHLSGGERATMVICYSWTTVRSW